MPQKLFYVETFNSSICRNYYSLSAGSEGGSGVSVNRQCFGVAPKGLSFCLIKEFFFTSCSLESFTVWQTPKELSHASYSKWFLSSHSTIKAWLMECCWDDCLSSRFSHRYRGHPKLSERLLECRSNCLNIPSCWVTRFSWISTCKSLRSLCSCKIYKNLGTVSCNCS